jgi:hypothetical protein
MSISSSRYAIPIYILIFAIVSMALIGATDYFAIKGNAGLTIGQFFLEAGLCLFICQSSGNLSCFISEPPKTPQSFLLRYVILIGMPTAFVPLAAVFVLLAMGMGSLLSQDAGILILSVIAGLTYFIAILVFGLALPGALRDPKDTIRQSVQRSLRQLGFVLPRLIFVMAPFNVAAFALPIAAFTFGISDGNLDTALVTQPADIAVLFLSKVLTGVALAGFSATIMAAYQNDLEEVPDH